MPRLASSDDQEILINDSWSGQNNRLLLGIASQAFAKIDPTVLAETGYWFTRGCVERVDIAPNRRKYTPLVPRNPIDDTAVGATPRNSGIKSPQQLSRAGVQSYHLVCGSDAEENAIHDNRLGL
jgi:hypothetical protein